MQDYMGLTTDNGSAVSSQRTAHMATTANIHAPLGAATILHVVDAFTNVVNTVVEWKESRKTRKLLSELSDAQLDDIGLSRADIADL
ncbi:hypothetical protein FIU92_16540 [Ruegeria sp. THAF33]|nr:hypothetical protein FIU92_16540 [Ruegeria sp. THAF33]